MNRSLLTLFSASDEQLMWRVKMDDDPHAFARLVSRWEKPIQNLCARMTGDVHRAQDLTQTVFARVFARRADWQPSGKLSTFLWRIALNLCHDEQRRARTRSEFSLNALEEIDGTDTPSFATEDPSPDSHAESQERGALVRDALAALPPPYREVVVLRHYEGLKFREIADVLGIPEGTVKSRMSDALSQLNQLLKHLNEDVPCNQKNRIPEARML